MIRETRVKVHFGLSSKVPGAERGLGLELKDLDSIPDWSPW